MNEEDTIIENYYIHIEKAKTITMTNHIQQVLDAEGDGLYERAMALAKVGGTGQLRGFSSSMLTASPSDRPEGLHV